MTRQSRSQHYRSKQVLFSGSKRKREYGLGKKTKKRKPRKPKKNENKKSKRRKSARRPRQPSGFRVSRGGSRFNWPWSGSSKKITNKYPEFTLGERHELEGARDAQMAARVMQNARDAEDAQDAGKFLPLEEGEKPHPMALTVKQLISTAREMLTKYYPYVSQDTLRDEQIIDMLTKTEKCNGNPDMDSVVIGLFTLLS